MREFKTPQGQRKAQRILQEHGIEGVIVIGGDGSLRGAMALDRQGIKVVGVPASIDNDIWGTNMCIGVDTSLNTILDALDRLRDTANSHNRGFVIEVMGRNCGYLALMGGILGGAEIIVTPEDPPTMEDVALALEDAYKRGKSHDRRDLRGRAVPDNRSGRLLEQPSHRLRDPHHDTRPYPARRQLTAFDRLLASRMGSPR
ncbi:MAG: hypothetical protein HND48_13740 [Chloroflexi bacterium]|nr:hypothetical protein [Chloroflexota bacterium]